MNLLIDREIESSLNNVTKVLWNGQETTSNYTYTYNEDNFPAKRRPTNEEGLSAWINYYYE